MIYFAQHKKTGYILMATSDDLQKDLSELEQTEGGIDFLGVMQGGDDELHELWQRYGIWKVEDTDSWLLDVPEINEFIYANATFPKSPRLKTSARYKTSDYTPIKQQALEAALQQQLSLIVAITKNWTSAAAYQYVDLNAGPGLTIDGQPGSPLIFRSIAEDYAKEWKNFRYEATLFESDTQTYRRLVKVLGDDNRFVIRDTDHEEFRRDLETAKERLAQKKRRWVFGAIYTDPSNADLPWGLLEQANEVYPAVDVMINIACASYKRTISSAGYATLAERLPLIKKHWIVRRPSGKHQWSILIGTNWPKYPDWNARGFYAWNDNGIGTSIFEKLVYTPEQIQERLQMKMPLQWRED